MKERIGITSFQDQNVTTDSKSNKDLDEIKFGSTCNKLVSVKLIWTITYNKFVKVDNNGT